MLKQLIKYFISLMLFLIIINFFCLIFNYTGNHVTDKELATDYRWNAKSFMSTMKEGYAWIHMDENGYNNLSTSSKIDILLLGSSHMEAVQIAQTKNCGTLLNEKMRKYYSYNIGISGHNINVNIDNINNAIKRFSPQKYIIIETSTVKLDEEDIKKVINSERKKDIANEDLISYKIQKNPLIKVLGKQLSKMYENDFKQEENMVDDKDNNYKELLKEELSIVSKTATENEIIPIIFYHPKEILNKDGTVTYDTDEEYLKMFSDTCNELGIVFVDVTPYFERMYKEEHKLAHGFSNTHVASGHLNENGHRAVAEALCDKINELEGDQ